ncbi:MAG: hypothetical protein ACJ76H_12490 [Bacteriovoracaceae bacterium]
MFNRSLTLSLLALVLVAACDKNESKKSSSVTALEGMSAEKGWCAVQPLTPSTEVVTRVEFLSRDRFAMTRILVDYKSATSFKIPTTIAYDDPSTPFGYTRRDISGYGVRDLRSYNDQKKITETRLVDRPYLQNVNRNFSPTTAVVMKSMTGETEFFPCRDYSKTLDSKLFESPSLNLQVLMGQATLSDGNGVLPKKMMLDLPVKKVKVTPKDLEGTQWCRWYEMTTEENPLVEIMTFHPTSYRVNQYAGILKVYEDYPHVLQDSAEDGEMVDLEETDEGLIKNFTMMEDAEGVRVLSVVANETTIVSYEHMFYSCDDQRPLKAYPKYKKFLPQMLELEKKY